MSWLYSRVLVEEYSAATCSAGAQSALSSLSPTPQAFLPSDKMTAFSRLSRSGMTFAPLTEDLGEDLLTWFLGDSRVRTFQLPGMAPELTESVPAFGEKWHESSVRYDRDSSSWKTHRCLWEEDLPWSSVILPSWGMTLDGVLWEPPTLGRPISETGYGLWPTPNACKASNDVTLQKSGDGRARPNKLGWAVAMRTWPTPVASMSKGSSSASLTRKSGADRSNDRLDHAVMASDGGQLNPTWVEWLMGWPLEWTALKPLEMAKFREWQQQHSLISPKAGSEAA